MTPWHLIAAKYKDSARFNISATAMRNEIGHYNPRPKGSGTRFLIRRPSLNGTFSLRRWCASMKNICLWANTVSYVVALPSHEPTEKCRLWLASAQIGFGFSSLLSALEKQIA